MSMIFVITGPTGSGKTSLACTITSRYHLPIINADAFQIYKEMDIGTAKISKDDPLYKSHYLIDIVNPDKSYSVKQYQDDFNRIIYDLLKNNKDVIICGGTGLYIKAALYDYTFPEQEEIDTSKYDSLSNEELYNRLLSLDKESASKIHMNNRKRVIRALAIAENSSITKSENIASQEHKLKFNEEEVKIVNDEEMIEIENKDIKIEEVKEEIVKEEKPVVEKKRVKEENADKQEEKKEKKETQLTMSDFFEEFKI